jgi:hypothetical protein
MKSILPKANGYGAAGVVAEVRQKPLIPENLREWLWDNVYDPKGDGVFRGDIKEILVRINAGLPRYSYCGPGYGTELGPTPDVRGEGWFGLTREGDSGLDIKPGFGGENGASPDALPRPKFGPDAI